MTSKRDYIEEFFLKFSYSQKLIFVFFCTFVSFGFITYGLWICCFSIYEEASLDHKTFQIQKNVNYINYLTSKYNIEINSRYTSATPRDPHLIFGLREEVDNALDSLLTQIRSVPAKLDGKEPIHIDSLEGFVAQWNRNKIAEPNSNVLVSRSDLEHLAYLLQLLRTRLAQAYRLYSNDDEGTKRLIDATFIHLPQLMNIVPSIHAIESKESQESVFRRGDLIIASKRIEEIGALIRIILNDISEMIDPSLGFDSKSTIQEIVESVMAANREERDIAAGNFSERETALHAIEVYYTAQKELEKILDILLSTQARALFIRLVVGGSCLLIALLFVLIIYFSKIILQPLNTLAAAANELAIGKVNVRVEVHSDDEIGEISLAFNALASFLEGKLLEVKVVSNSLLRAVNQVFRLSDKLQENISLQDQELNLMKKHIQEISVVARDFSTDLTNVYKSISATTGIADVGRRSLSEMERVMKQIVNASEQIQGTLNGLNYKITSINEVINTIVKIADQVNLLSLNSAIQANKAGPEGKGFTVIARKIRELSGQTAFATIEIENNVKEVVKTVDTSTEEVRRFMNQLTLQVGESNLLSEEFKELIHYFQNQVEVFNSVNSDMNKQAASATELQAMLMSLSKASRQTKMSVNQFYSEIDSLHHSTINLVEKIDSFTHPSYLSIAAERAGLES